MQLGALRRTDAQSMASMGSQANAAVRKSIRGLTKVTEPEVTRTRYTLIGLVLVVLVIGIAQLIWLNSAVHRLSGLTDALTEAGWRMLDFEYAMSYVDEIGRYSLTRRGSNTSNSLDPVLLIYDKIGEADPDDPLHDVAFMAAHSSSLRHHHHHLYEMEERGGVDAFAFELADHIVVKQPASDPSSDATIARTTNLVDLGLEMHGAIERLVELEIG